MSRVELIALAVEKWNDVLFSLNFLMVRMPKEAAKSRFSADVRITRHFALTAPQPSFQID